MTRYLFLYEEDGIDRYEFVDANDAVEATVKFYEDHAYSSSQIDFILDNNGNYLYNSEEL